ncbi:hypothetical protein N788_11320 [Arenimonas donghaensis DSM 18148 = HO3-R19]|uniref:Uncharacterized protein n=1 Tax=Arenimonas donghaensis DSM 18148 = HO3-R19 TaxID=1121014 RepID=A0A087MJQ5_9GAMM|nr:hypothetical protein N788_11320 [Arenimonas donghaensis DSM 18148 = HO3-R19]
MFAAATIQAAEPAPATAESGSCAKAATEAEKPVESSVGETSPAPGATAPVRPRSSGASGRPAPRWNSLLPGMIR